MRLIDADELKEKLTELKQNKLTPSWSVVLNLIDNAPTVEAKTTADCIIAYGDGYKTARRLSERPQGEWKYNQYDGNPNIGNWHCSECRYIVFGGYNQKPYYNFCPNCGAEMRGEKNNNIAQ